MCGLGFGIIFDRVRIAALAAQLKDGGRIAAIFMQGALGTVRIGRKQGGVVNWRFAFNATAPVLPGFAAARTFML